MKSLILAAVLLLFQPDAQTSVIRSIRYENFKGVSIDQVQARFKDRGVRLAVEEFYEPKQLEAARQGLQDLLEEKGRGGETVKADVRKIPPHSVEITFKAVK